MRHDARHENRLDDTDRPDDTASAGDSTKAPPQPTDPRTAHAHDTTTRLASTPRLERP